MLELDHVVLGASHDGAVTEDVQALTTRQGVEPGAHRAALLPLALGTRDAEEGLGYTSSASSQLLNIRSGRP